jgi:adenine/guanine/hypoxanthine permease
VLIFHQKMKKRCKTMISKSTEIFGLMIKHFDLHNNGTRFSTELSAGITTFLAAMYIILVNPLILSEAGLPYSAALTMTILVSAISTIIMGLYSNNPLLIAPGMSINHLFVAVLIRYEVMSYQTAFGCVFWAGAIYLLLLLLDRNKKYILKVPRMLRFGMAGGIGLFIAMLGFLSAGFIIFNENGGLTIGEMNATKLTFLAGLALTSALVARKIPGAFIIGVIGTTLLALPIGRLWGDASHLSSGTTEAVLWQGWYSPPDFSLFLQIDLIGALHPSYWTFILVLLFSCFFDSFATCAGVCEAGDLVDENGEPRNLERSLRANAVAVLISGLMGTSPATTYVESSTGARVGGRTGLAAVIAGSLFLPFLFFSPLLSLVPPMATAPILVLSGIFMLKPLIYVRWERFDEALPFFMAMVLMPLTGSITQGAIWGILSWIVIKAANGKFRAISPVMIFLGIAAVFLLFNAKYFYH